MEEITQWQHFKKNFLGIAVGFVILGIFLYFNIEEETKWISVFPIITGAILVPIGNYLSWKGRLQ